MKKLNDRTAWKTAHPSDLTIDKKRKAMESLIFLTEKRRKSRKGRSCANTSTQRSHVPKEETSIPTVTTYSVIATSVMEAKQERCITTMGISNTLAQSEVPQGDERITINIRGALADMLIEIDP